MRANRIGYLLGLLLYIFDTNTYCYGTDAKLIPGQGFQEKFHS